MQVFVCGTGEELKCLSNSVYMYFLLLRVQDSVWSLWHSGYVYVLFWKLQSWVHCSQSCADLGSPQSKLCGAGFTTESKLCRVGFNTVKVAQSWVHYLQKQKLCRAGFTTYEVKVVQSWVHYRVKVVQSCCNLSHCNHHRMGVAKSLREQKSSALTVWQTLLVSQSSSTE